MSAGRVSELRALGVLSALDERLSQQLCASCAERDERVQLAAALLSRHVAQGHVCLPLLELARGELQLGEDAAQLGGSWPEPEAWLAALRGSALCGDEGSELTPLVLDARGRLYLRRHFRAERALCAQITRRLGQPVPAPSDALLARLDRYFGPDRSDLQRAAAELALRRAFCVISGGPGTGKTSTVVRILALALEEAAARGEPLPRIALLAPTGKAAVRLEAAVRGAKQGLPCAPALLEAIPEQAQTIHRALRGRARGPERAQLPLDLLLVDEASMVDLELMNELLAAISPAARVILLGDRDQLASVEAGAVLGDMCEAFGRAAERGAPAALIQLTRSYRYAADSGIGQLARAVQAGDVERALALLEDPSQPDVQRFDVRGAQLALDPRGAQLALDPRGAQLALDPRGAQLAPELQEAVVRGYAPYLGALADPRQALRAFDRFRVLCAHRRGEAGVEALNRACARLLFERGYFAQSAGQFAGRMLLVTENDYRNNVFNGDVGLVARDPQGELLAFFLTPDAELRGLGLGRLPPHESAFALSVHKSQGSEVDEVALVLPPEPSRILSRELIYTALTRAKRRVTIFGSAQVFAAALHARVSRNTGLQELLAPP